MYRDYAPKGVKFYYIYKSLAHPELNGYVQPVSLEERVMHVAEARRTLGSEIPWVIDAMTNDVKHALGDAPNSEYIIDPAGKVVIKRSWSNPSSLRQDLASLVGKVVSPTRVADLDLKIAPSPKLAASGVVPRLEVPGRLQAVKVEPKTGLMAEPFYVKLRAEVEQSLLRGGDGQLYLGFHLDPIYYVHWNNLVAPIRFEITATDGTVVTPSRGSGPEVKVASDVDPREFLVAVKSPNGPMTLKLDYFACNDEEGWCKPVSQEYLIFLEADRDAGRPMRGPGFGGGGGRSGAVSRGGPGGGNRPSGIFSGMLARMPLIAALDLDADGTIDTAELAKADTSLRTLDKNEDGELEASELMPSFGGSRARPSRPSSSRRPSTEGGARPQFFSAEQLKRLDRDQDGEISTDEIPRQMRELTLGRVDANEDGVISQSELDKLNGRRSP